MSISISEIENIVSDILLFLDAENIKTLEGIAGRSGKNYAIKDSKGTIFVDEKSGCLGSIVLTLAYNLADKGTVLEIEFNKTYHHAKIYALAGVLLNRYHPLGPEQPLGIPQWTTSGCSIESVRASLSRIIHPHDTGQYRIKDALRDDKTTQNTEE